MLLTLSTYTYLQTIAVFLQKQNENPVSSMTVKKEIHFRFIFKKQNRFVKKKKKRNNVHLIIVHIIISDTQYNFIADFLKQT